MRWGGSARAAGWVLFCGSLTLACANEEAPPGTGPDLDPPRVVERYPEYRSVRAGFRGDAYVRFDEPLADPRSVERLVVGSPADRFRVESGRSHVRIRPVGEWRPNAVYYLRIQPGVADLLRNRTTNAIELLFSTGPDLTDTSAEGRVYDRLRVQSVRDARLLFLGLDSIPYTTVSDTGGVFSLPSLPPGSYWTYAFRDENRNLSLDREFEPHDSALLALEGPQSRSDLVLWITEPDSTPPVLVRAEPLDSLRLRLEFDEPLEPEAGLDEASVRISGGGEEPEWPIATIGYEAAGGPDRARASASGAEATEPVADTAGRDPLVAENETDSLQGPVARPDGDPLARAVPTPFFAVGLGRPLVPGSYRIIVSGLVNLRGLAGGGDTTFVYEAPPGPPAPVSPDSVADESGDSIIAPGPVPTLAMPVDGGVRADSGASDIP